MWPVRSTPSASTGCARSSRHRPTSRRTRAARRSCSASLSYRDTLLPLFSLRGLLGFPLAIPTRPAEGRRDDHRRRPGRAGGRPDARHLTVDPALMEPTPSVLAARTGGEARIKAIYRGDEGRRLDFDPRTRADLFREDVMQRLGAGRGNASSTLVEEQAAPREERAVSRLPPGRRRVRPAHRGGGRGRPVPAQITRVPQTPEVPRRRHQPAGRGLAGGRPAAPLRHAQAGGRRRPPPRGGAHASVIGPA